MATADTTGRPLEIAPGTSAQKVLLAGQIAGFAGIRKHLEADEVDFVADKLAPFLQLLSLKAIEHQPRNLPEFLANLLKESQAAQDQSGMAPRALDVCFNSDCEQQRNAGFSRKAGEYQGHYAQLLHFIEECKNDIPESQYQRLLTAVEGLAARDHTVSVDQVLFEGREEETQLVLGGLGIDLHQSEHRRTEYPAPPTPQAAASAAHAVSSVETCLVSFHGSRRMSISQTEADGLLSDISWARRWQRMEHEDVSVHIQTLIHAFQAQGLVQRYSIELNCLTSWCDDISSAYDDNPYHNWRHAVDVFHLVYAMITTGGAGRFLNFQDILSLLVAAVGHDAGHFGVNNAFLVNTGHLLALRYNDKAPLENMHAATVFETYHQPGRTFLQKMRKHDWEVFRSKVVECILATDMSHHFELVERMANRLAEQQEDPLLTDTKGDRAKQNKSKKDRRLMMQAFTHMADLGSNCQPWPLHRRLVASLEQEFFNQGDQEKERGLPVMPMMDRTKDSAAAAQNFFLGKLVRPLLEPCAAVLVNDVGQVLMANLDDNIRRWAIVVERFPKMTAQEIMKLLDEEDDAA